METKKQLIKEREEIEKSIVISNSKIQDLKKERDKTCKDWEKATKETKKKLEELSNPFEEKSDSIDKQKSDTQNKICDLERQSKQLNEKIKYSDALVKGEYNSESFGGRFNFLSGKSYYSIEISEKKRLKNGIQIFRVLDEYNYTEWFAFYGLKCVGFSYRVAGRHRGDITYPFSFIGNIKEELKVEGEYNRLKNATFTEWKKILEKKDPSKLKEIDLENKDVQSKAIKHEGLY